MAAAVDDRDDDVPVVLPGLRFGRGYRLLGLIKRYWRAIVTNTFMNGRLRRSDAFAAGKFHVEPPSPSSCANSMISPILLVVRSRLPDPGSLHMMTYQVPQKGISSGGCARSPERCNISMMVERSRLSPRAGECRRTDGRCRQVARE